MKKRLFAVPSMLAAGFLPVEANAIPPMHPTDHGLKTKSLFDVFRLNHVYTLAGHSSHSSHASHASHRSSSGGYYYSPPSQSYSPPPSIAQPPASPPALKTLPGNTQKFLEIVQDVQFALLAFGYYNGPVDGSFNPQLQAALAKMQQDYGLKVTGTITPETLDALRITAK